jgi:hypothetical protein
VIPLQVPDAGFLQRIGLVVFLVSELEGWLITDLVRFHSVLPPGLDFATMEGMRVTGMTTTKMGRYFLDHAPATTDSRVAEYYRVGGQALLEIGPKRNAMLHARPGVDGYDPEQKLRLVRWRIGTEKQNETHMISDAWLDEFVRRLRDLRDVVLAARPDTPVAG